MWLVFRPYGPKNQPRAVTSALLTKTALQAHMFSAVLVIHFAPQGEMNHKPKKEKYR